jgi:Protein of unknown function DUF262/Restriction Enzyme Adenine Methylase Associated
MDDMADAPIQAQGMNVSALFANRRFGILYYQREYSWSRADVKILLNDLHQRFMASWNPAQSARKIHRYPTYFLGSIVYYEEDGTTYVVDGQQRITTLHLLLIHLYRLLKEQDADSEARRLETLIRPGWGNQDYAIDVADYAYIYNALMEGGSVRLRSGASASETHLLARGRDLDEDFPADLCGEALIPFVQWLLERVCLAGIRAEGRDHGWQIFETTNDRGVRLGPIDLLKSRLLVMAESGQENLNKQWREMLSRLNDVGPRVPTDYIKTYLLAKHVNIDDEADRRQANDAFHEWVRLHPQELGLRSAGDYGVLVRNQIAPLGAHYAMLAYAALYWNEGWSAALFYNERNQIPHHIAAVLAAVRADDTTGTVQQKAALVSGYLDLLFVYRLITIGAADTGVLEDDVLSLIVRLRVCDTLEALRSTLVDELADESTRLGDAFAQTPKLKSFGRTPHNAPQVRYLLARLTAFVETARGRANPIEQYLDAERPFEIFAIWGEDFARYSAEAGGRRSTFDSLRHRLGALLLLPADDCAQLPALAYPAQLDVLGNRHALAASLAPRSHEQGLFKGWTESRNLTGLLRPFPRAFTKEAVEQRQQLYLQLCRLVWDRSELGLAAPDGPRRAQRIPHKSAVSRAGSTAAKAGSTLEPLLKAGIINADEPLISKRKKGVEHSAMVDADGAVLLPTGERFPDPDQAGAFVLGQRSCQGWKLWQVVRSGGLVTLDVLRTEAVDVGLIDL